MESLTNVLNFLFYIVIILAVIYVVYVLYIYQEADGEKYEFTVKNSANKDITLILLRHGSRTGDSSFYTELDATGKIQADNLVGELNKYNIDEIISSPFIRTLQTVYPFAEASQKPIKIDYGIYEYRTSNNFKRDPNVYTTSDIQQQYLTDKLDNSYTSSIQPNNLELNRNEYGKVQLETAEQLQKRVKTFLDNILSTSAFNGKTLLIVSHAGVINMMREYLKNGVGGSKNTVSDSLAYKPFPFAHYVVYQQKS